MTSVYLLTMAGNSPIEISQDELRSLLDEIETELHQSKVYRRALGMLQKLLGTSAEQGHALFKAVSREAIGLTFHKFAQQHKKVADANPSDNEVETLVVEEADYTELSECLTTVKPHPKSAIATTTQVNSLSESDVVAQTEDTPKPQEDETKKKVSKAWFRSKKKPSKAELAKLKAAQEREESLRLIGQQLRSARESQSLSLVQLNVYTHVPIHYMEAVENGNWELLPEEVFVRGFIRVMGNALALNGTNLAASLPAPEVAKSILPAKKYQSKGSSVVFELPAIHPVHLYVGYTALVAGAVGGLSVISQQANANKLNNSEAVTPPSSFTQSMHDKKESTTKPGLQSSTAGVAVGPDISPPEAL